MSIEAMKQALEALKDWKKGFADLWQKSDEEAITSLRQAIAEAEKQKPLCTAAMFDKWFLAKSGLDPKTPLYTHPQPRKPLTDEEISEWVESHPYYGYGNTEYREGLEEGAKWARDKFAARGIKE